MATEQIVIRRDVSIRFDDMDGPRFGFFLFEFPTDWESGVILKGQCLPKNSGEHVVLRSCLIPKDGSLLSDKDATTLVLPAGSGEFSMLLNRNGAIGGELTALTFERTGTSTADTARGDWFLARLELRPVSETNRSTEERTA